jgi:hypothetical protein
VTLRDRGDERLAAERGEPHARQRVRVPHHREVELAALHRCDQSRREALGELDPDQRVPLPEALDALDRPERQRGDHEPDVQPTGLAPTDGHRLVQVAPDLGQEGPGTPLQHLPRRGERHAAGRPREQVDTEAHLDPPDQL